MALALDTVQWASNLLYIALGVFAGRVWLRQRTSAAAWLALTFGGLGAVLAIAVAAELAGADPLPTLVTWVVVAGILLFPWCLLRFAAAQGGAVRAQRVADVSVALVLLATPFVDLSPDASGTATAVYLLAFIAVFAGTAVAAGVHLLRHGPRARSLMRTRSRLMGLGAIGVALSLALSTVADQQVNALALAASVVGLLAGLAFLLGFSPPALLRAYWRRFDEDRMFGAIAEVVAADDVDAMSERVVEDLLHSLGARGILVIDGDDEVVITAGELPEGDVEASPATLSIGLEEGTRVVLHTGVLSPFVGEDEVRLVRRLAMMATMAGERAEALEIERAARKEAEAARAAQAEANSALLRANADLRSLADTAAHDLRNPLTTIMGAASTVRALEVERLDERSDMLLERLEANARYMDEMLEQVLSLARLGRDGAEPDDVDLAALVDGVRGDLEREGRPIDVVVGSLPNVHVNAVHARRLVTNLLVNAYRHAGPNARVEIRLADADDRDVVIHVADDGPGVPPDERERVFETFHRLDRTRKGTGLGLPICRRMVEGAGGSISLVDPPSGRGACFELVLPRSRPATREGSTRRADTASDDGGAHAALAPVDEERDGAATSGASPATTMDARPVATGSAAPRRRHRAA